MNEYVWNMYRYTGWAKLNDTTYRFVLLAIECIYKIK